MFAGIISFWTPASIMVYVYAMVYKEMKRLQSSFKNGRIVSLNQNQSEDCLNDLHNCDRNESLDIDRNEVVKFHKKSSLIDNSDHICVPLHLHDPTAAKTTAPPTPTTPPTSTSFPTMTISNQERESRSGNNLNLIKINLNKLFYICWLGFRCLTK